MKFFEETPTIAGSYIVAYEIEHSGERCVAEWVLHDAKSTRDGEPWWSLPQAGDGLWSSTWTRVHIVHGFAKMPRFPKNIQNAQT